VNKLVLIGCTAIAALGVLALVASRHENTDAAHETGAKSRAHPAPRQPDDRPSNPETSPPRPDPPEDPLSARWDDLSAEERIHAARTMFREAVEDVTAGTDIERNVAIAEAALTTLRPELYASVNGQQEHQALEAELEALTAEVEATWRD
jgi:hypothetical protein